MLRRALFMLLCLFSSQAFAGPWIVGQQPIIFTSSHTLGDGSNARGGEAPYYASEPADIATSPTIVSAWSPSGFGEYDAPPTATEAKARFDCNHVDEAKDDPLLAPGVSGGSSHRHTFFGNNAFNGNEANATYAGLRASGYSTCYGGPMNRTLYWEPTMFTTTANGVPVAIKPNNIITYYICGDVAVPSGVQKGPANCSRWPRGFNQIFGFNMSDPTNSYERNAVAAGAQAGTSMQYPATNPAGVEWACLVPNGAGVTSYAPSPTAPEPYFNDGLGHSTLDCKPETVNGESVYRIIGTITSNDCWDGKNPTSPDGRKHMFPRVRSGYGGTWCPDGWYETIRFVARPSYIFHSMAEIGNAYLSSDRMPGMTRYRGGETLHADLIPAWDYGTGDHPGFMLRFFQHCNGLTMHVKNSDGVTYTDLIGDPHTCGYGRVDASTNAVVDTTPPDGMGPNPVVNLNPNQVGINRYFPLAPGTVLTLPVMTHKHH